MANRCQRIAKQISLLRSFCHPFAIHLSFCDLFLLLSILGFCLWSVSANTSHTQTPCCQFFYTGPPDGRLVTNRSGRITTILPKVFYEEVSTTKVIRTGISLKGIGLKRYQQQKVSATKGISNKRY